MRTLYQRLKKVLKPDWKLDSGHDFAGKSEWLCHFAIAWQGLSAIGKSLVSGESMGQCFLNGANYDPLTVQQLRDSLEVANNVLAMPARNVAKEVAAAG
jgi:hypothetical protein